MDDKLKEKVKEQIKNYIKKNFLFDRRDLDDDEPLFEPGLIDSLGFISLLAFIEKNFRINIRMSEVVIEKFNNVNKISEIVSGKMARGAK